MTNVYAYPPPPAARRWWHHPAVIITLLVVFPPGGIALAWTTGWSKGKKIVSTVLAGLWFLLIVVSDPPKERPAEAKPKTQPTAPKMAVPAPSASPTPSSSPSPTGPPSFIGQNLVDASAAALKAGYNSISHDASEGDAGQWSDKNWRVCFQALAAKQSGKLPTLDFGVVRNEEPCPAKDGDPIPWPKMPGVTGMTFKKATETLTPLGTKKIEPTSAYTDVKLPASGVDGWTVCFQEPEAGQEVHAGATAYLSLTDPGTSCPKEKFTELHPDPAPGDDDSSGSESSASGGGGQSGVRYGQFCSPVGARATTSDGRPAKCFIGKDGRARWGYGS
ncbi:PASTA domain-containing protein [Streptomyces sp. NPDC059874]|uniref:PASTA domain-containing protein n=1 Tax=Streptomyces sp. NPDC059874 TaxID=3346983 RepID=UPI00364F77EB